MQQHPLTRLSRRAQRGEGPLARLLRAAALSPVYQPIASLTTGAIFAHEALIRGPLDSPMHSPVALLKAAAIARLPAEASDERTRVWNERFYLPLLLVMVLLLPRFRGRGGWRRKS